MLKDLSIVITFLCYFIIIYIKIPLSEPETNTYNPFLYRKLGLVHVEMLRSRSLKLL